MENDSEEEDDDNELKPAAVTQLDDKEDSDNSEDSYVVDFVSF